MNIAEIMNEKTADKVKNDMLLEELNNVKLDMM